MLGAPCSLSPSREARGTGRTIVNIRLLLFASCLITTSILCKSSQLWGEPFREEGSACPSSSALADFTPVGELPQERVDLRQHGNEGNNTLLCFSFERSEQPSSPSASV